jgi:hypothetical protein
LSPPLVIIRPHAVTPTEPADAHSILPLAVLEAMRSLDSPSDEEVAEYVDELLKKRLGLSDTVAAQIARYEVTVRQDGSVRAGEMEQIFRLAGRRTDAALVFADGGRRAARRSLKRLSGFTRWGAQYLPRPVRRAIGFRGARGAAFEVFGAALSREDREAVATVTEQVAVRATPDGAACAFYAAALAELLRQLLDFEGVMTHSRCRSRGDECCEWRTNPSLERRP